MSLVPVEVKPQGLKPRGPRPPDVAGIRALDSARAHRALLCGLTDDVIAQAIAVHVEAMGAVHPNGTVDHFTRTRAARGLLELIPREHGNSPHARAVVEVAFEPWFKELVESRRYAR